MSIGGDIEVHFWVRLSDGGTAISWKSKKQLCIALSMAEAKYVALTSSQESFWLKVSTRKNMTILDLD